MADKSPLQANTRQGFVYGYRNREDVATLRPDILVEGSQNVLTNTYKRIGSRAGYTVDGQRGTANSGLGIYGVFDWLMHTGSERNFRAGLDSTGLHGKVQYRYVANAGDKYLTNTFTAGQVYWIDLHGTDLYTECGTSFNACRFWDFTNELKDLLLWVDGTSNIFMWSGAVDLLESASWATGSVETVVATPTVAGTGYAVGNTLTVTTGGTGCTVRVDTIGAGGAVTAVSLLTPGTGYTTGAGKATSGGAGTLCTIEIGSVVQGYIKLVTNTAGGSGFLSSGTYQQNVSINGNLYSYSAIAGGYLIGLNADPTAEAVSSIVHQTPERFSNASASGIPAVFKNHIIENLNNQIYLSASDNNSVYVSKVNSFLDYQFASPRKVGEGAILTLDGVPKTLQQQSDSMFISAGNNYWYQTKFTIATDGLSEQLSITPIKSTVNQACQSDYLATKIKNLVAFVSSEVQINTIGVSANFFTEAQVSDISAPIVHDIEQRDFTDGMIKYHQKYLYITSPKTGTVFIYNMTQDVTDGLVDASSASFSNSATHYWEAPQTIPIAKLSIINGELYGHAYNEFNTYKLFNGVSDDEKPMKAVALFAYDTYGDRTATKSDTQFFIEGYKATDTELTAYKRRGLNGAVANWTFGVLPDRCLIPPVDDASIGKTSIGKTSIGGTESVIVSMPKFRLIQTHNRIPYFEQQLGFSSEGISQNWEIVAFSTNATNTTENQASILDPNS